MSKHEQIEIAHYTKSMRALHWTSAGLVIFTTGLGFGLSYEWFKDMPVPGKSVFSVHVLLGLLVLVLTSARLIVRLRSTPPPIRGSAIQRRAAHIVHGSLYLLLFAMPLSAYAMYLAEGKAPKPFGLQLPAFGANKASASEALSDIFWKLHEYGAWALLALFALHVAAALYRSGSSHKDDTVDGLSRMMAPKRHDAVKLS